MPTWSSPAAPSPSHQLIPIDTKPENPPTDLSALNLVPGKHKKTRDLPNLSDCHGCGRRINYSNPSERLQPLDSVWRLVLLCKKCRKQVNSGQLCPYCFKDTSESVSDCFSCENCHHHVHKDCILKYEKSAPRGYSDGLGVEVTVCIDCWVPELLRRSIRVREKNRGGKGLALRSVHSNMHCESLGKDNSPNRSSKEVKEERKVSFAVKAKESALRKAAAARKMVEPVNDSSDLAVKESDKGKEKLGLVDDAELALQLSLAMNGSARIPKNVKRAKDGEIAGYRTHQENISVEANGSRTFMELQPELFTYKRKNKKMKSLQQSCIETSQNHTSTSELKPELLTYKRNRRKKADSLQSNIEDIEICTCSYTGAPKPELVTYEHSSMKRKECLPSVVKENGSCCTIEFSKLKSESLSFEHNDEKECQVFDQTGNGSCTFVSSAVSKPELATYKRKKKKTKEKQEIGAQVYENHDSNDSLRQTSELFTYKRKNKKVKGSDGGPLKPCTHADVSSLVTNSQHSLQDDEKGVILSNDGESSSPEGRIIDCEDVDRNCNSMAGTFLSIADERSSGGDDLNQDRIGDSHPRLFSLTYSRRTAASRSTLPDSNGKLNCNSCLWKYSRRIKRSGERLHKEPESPHDTGCESIQTETELSALGTHTNCLEKDSMLSEQSWDVQLQTCS